MSGPCAWRLGPPLPAPLEFASPEPEPEAEQAKETDEEPRRVRTVRRTQK